MILGAERTKPREIGGRHTGVWVNYVLYADQPFVVLRETTYEEWAAEQVQAGLTSMSAWDYAACANPATPQ